jgi:hypothetical protein
MKPVRSLVPLVPARVVTAVAVAVLICLAPLATARAQVLQQVPGDSLVVIKINKLKPVSDKIAAFAQKLGLDQMQPGFADPLGAMQKQMGITQGLDPNGEAAVVFVNGPMNDKEPPLLVLFPVSDYNAFLKNFPNAKTEDQISIVKMKGESKDSFVMKRGNFAALAPKRQYLEMKAEGIQPAGLSAKEMESKDVVAYVNMKTARTRILPELKKNRAKILADFEKGFRQGGQQPPPRRAPAPGAGAEDVGAAEEGAAGGAAGAAAKAKANAQREKFLPLAKAVVTRVLDVAEQVIGDADAATYGWSFADTGLQATGLVEFTPNSPSAQRVAELKGSGESLTKGLPEGKYWFFGGTAGENAAVGQKMINDFLAPIEKELAPLGAEGQALKGYLDGLRQYVSNLKGQSMGWVAPQGMIGQEAVVQVVSVQRGNAPQMMEAAKKMFDSQQAAMQLMGGPAAQQELKTNYTPKAKTVDGVTFDLMQTTFVPPAGGQRTPQQMQAQQMMTWMYGPGGVNAYIGALGNDKVVTATGVNDEMLKKLVAAAKADQDPLGSSKPVADTNAHLPKQRIVGWYFSLDNFATSVANYAKAFGMPINLQVPQNLSPLGGAITTEGSAVRLDGYAPTQTLQSVIAAVMQTYMQMQGGQQPGGPGGL